MTEPRDSSADLLQVLVSLRESAIECDIVQIGVSTWAIHGVIPVDGEVLLAEFDTYEDAKSILEQVYATPSETG